MYKGKEEENMKTSNKFGNDPMKKYVLNKKHY